LVVRLPDGSEAGRRIDALTQSCDLFPTLLDLFGVPAVPTHGASLMPLLHGKAESVRAYAVSGNVLNQAMEWALRTQDWSFILPIQSDLSQPQRLPQLFVKPEDRWEVNSVLQHHPELVEGLEKTLRGFIEAASKPGPLLPPELPAEEEST
jgi:arylsulfatase A-like enzyme